MATYIRKISTIVLPDEIWEIDDDLAVKVEGSEPNPGIGNYYTRGSHPTIWHSLASQTGWLKADDLENSPFKKITLGQKEFYPRIYRPTIPDIAVTMRPPLAPPHEENVVSTNIGQATALTRRLETICQTVHPHKTNMSVFGHEIRSLLILACTEAETHWRGILSANGHRPKKFNTNEYIKLLDIMRLDQYAVKFPQYPWIAPILPFLGWDKSDPTKSLVWYDAYNATKHNREVEFDKATLSNALHAVSACIVMQVAQFGKRVGLGTRSELSAFFQFEATPDWELADCYVGVSFGKEWTEKLVDFSN